MPDLNWGEPHGGVGRGGRFDTKEGERIEREIEREKSKGKKMVVTCKPRFPKNSVVS